MPRYRLAFSREWALGRWGYLDRFFHDLGGHPSEPSGLDNAWIVEYRGQARRLGRELAKALNIQETDYRKFGPIFEIEEIAGPRRSKRAPAEPRHAEASDSARAEEQATEAAAGAADTAEALLAESQQGPSWLANTEVEDVAVDDAAEAGSEIDTATGLGARGVGAESAEGGSSQGVKARLDDLFRIRTRGKPKARRRADAIAGASRRRPPTGRPSSE
jgi:hypothetical protein